ncbi:MAG: hypothetical protein QW474_02220 [Candidatus Aenigmatarchaeota archaeon]
MLDEILKRNYFIMSIFGMRGYGKSFFMANVIKKFIEQKKAEKIIIIDVIGAITRYLDEKMIVFSEVEIKNEQITKNQMDRVINSDDVICFNLENLTTSEISVFVDLVSDYLLKYNIYNTAIFVDEIADILSQNYENYSYNFERLTRIGRNKKINYVVLTTQRLQKVNKNIIALSDFYVVFKTLHYLDLNMLKDLGFSDKLIEKIKKLQIGECAITNLIDWNYYSSSKQSLITQEEFQEPKETQKEQNKQEQEIKIHFGKHTERKKLKEEFLNGASIEELAKKYDFEKIFKTKNAAYLFFYRLQKKVSK